MNSILFNKLKRVNKEEDGQSIVFIALSLLFIVLFVFMVINTGDISTKKMKMVTAADATAISGATWMARGYNTTAMLNITESQILAIIVLIKATKQYHEISQTMLQAQLAIGEALSVVPEPITAAIGVFIVNYTNVLIPIDDTTRQLMESVRTSLLGENESGILWELIDGVTKSEEVVVKVFPFIAQVESVNVSVKNGATLGFLYPMIPLSDLKFPFKEDRKFEDLCKPTGEGKVKGFSKTIEHLPTTHYLGVPGDVGKFIDILTVGDFGPEPLEYFKAWLPYPIFRLLPPFLGFVYDAVAKATLNSMCGGSGDFTYETVQDGEHHCQSCFDNKDKLKKIIIGQTRIKTRFSMSGKKMDDVVGFIPCDCSNPQSSKCQSTGNITDSSGNTSEVCGYYDIKQSYIHKAKSVEEDCWKSEFTNRSQIDNFMQYLGQDCFKQRQTSELKDFEEGIYDLEYVEGGTEPNMRIPERDSDGNIIKDGNGNIIYKKVRIYTYTETKLISCTYDETKQAEGFSEGGGASAKDKAKPYMLEDDWAEKNKYVGIVYLKSQDHVLSTKNKLKNPNKLGIIYFSQTEIYVPDGVEAHLFNQCWRVRLVKFNMLSKLLDGDTSVLNQMEGMEDSIDNEANMDTSSGNFSGALNNLRGLSDDFIIH